MNLSNRHRSTSRGFTLLEVLVASAIFLVVAVAAYTALSSGNKLYKQGDAAAEMQQRTRLSFDLLMSELRLAGFDHNRDGEENAYPDHPDEQLEYVGEHAISFRANFDFDDETSGREPDYERGIGDPNYGLLCCPIVTTANDEIVTYALRSDDAEVNTGEITFNVDTSAPRDAGWDEDGVLVEEETVTIENVDLTGENPPYTLLRITLADDGTLVERAIATGLRGIEFSYQSSAGAAYHCSAYEEDGTCSAGSDLQFVDLGGSDDVATGDGLGRTGRAGIRHVNVEFVGASELEEPQYADADDELMPHRRKLVLAGTVSPPNLGLRGRPDLDDEESYAPTNVTACVGQCNTVRVEWDHVDRAMSYRVKLYLAGGTDPFFMNVTPSVLVPGTDPQRVQAVFQRTDASQIVVGTQLFATVESRLSGDEYSDESEPSDLVTLSDDARLEAPGDVVATGYDPAGAGWPDVGANELGPDTLGESSYGALVNKITVSWVPPAWEMDVTDAADPESWTAATSDSTLPAVECDAEMADTDADTVPDKLRTRNREMFGDIRFHVFRSTNPRFVPTTADLVASVPGVVDTATGRVSFTDGTAHYWRGGFFNYSISYIETCKTYYYRVRAVDDCYTGTNPAALDDVHLSPFFPPLNTTSGAVDTDDISSLSADDVGIAIPGYAIPQAAPRAPTNLRFSNYDRRTDDGDGIDGTIGFDAVKLDSHTITDAGGTTVADFADIVVSQYRVYRNNSHGGFSLQHCLEESNGVSLVKTIDIRDLGAGRIAYTDENGDTVISPSEDESRLPGGTPPPGSPQTALRIESSGASTWFYKVMAIQCTAEGTVPSGGTSYDYGALSAAIKFPCEFGGGALSLIDCDATNFPTSVTGTAFVENVLQPAQKAWLILLDPATGDRVMSTNHKPVSTLGVVSFNAAEIAALTDNFGNGTYRISVEMRDSADCIGVSDSDDQSPTVPACCLTPSSPVAATTGTLSARATVTESCGAATLRVNKITIDIDNTNRGQPERVESVYWGTTLLWTGSDRTVVIDRTSNPLLMSAFTAKDLNMNFSRNPRGDILTVTYEYRIGGSLGTCTFVQSNLQ